MRFRGAPLLVAAAAVVVAPTAAGTTPPAPGMTATLSSSAPGAGNVGLALRFESELQCGRLQASRIGVRLPPAMHVPVSIPRTAVTVSGRAPASVAVTRATVTLTLPRPTGVTCMVIGPGSVVLRFSARAGLRNPAKAGRYAVWLDVGRQALHGTLAIH